jgi:hypothetical protein
MSAEVIKLSDRKMHPGDFCKPLVAGCGGDDVRLFNLALVSLLAVEARRGSGNLEPSDLRDITNRLFIAWLAIGEILGIPSGEAEEHLPDNIA